MEDRRRPTVRVIILRVLLFALVPGASGGCTGTIETPETTFGGQGSNNSGVPGPGQPKPPAPGWASSFPRIGMRRLSKAELRSTIKDLTNVDPIADIPLLNEESIPFDNNYTTQNIDSRFVGAMNTIAENVARDLVTNTLNRSIALPCTTPDDACRVNIITTLGRRALRRPLDAQVEVPDLIALGRSEKDFLDGIQLVVRALLQSTEFLYRVEVGTPEGGSELLRLDGWEVASRLSYLLWGTMPSDDLFMLAAKDALKRPGDVQRAAQGMLDGSLGGQAALKKAKDRIARFHSMWLGYERTMPDTTAIGKKARAETNALLEKVILGPTRTSWFDIFRSKMTFIDDTLAAHYGDIARPMSSNGRWVSYGQSARQGILSHATFLSVGNGMGGDTSVTLRGKNIRNRLLCQVIAKPPADLKVDTSKPPQPTAGECRMDALHRTTLAKQPCIGCHQQMDLIGLGLDNYDSAGKYRATDNGKPQCPIDGKGGLVGAGGIEGFEGPAGLADLLLQREAATVEACVVTQFLTFANGRAPRTEEDGMKAAFAKAFEDGAQRFDELLLAFVSAPEFGYRLPE